MRKGGAGVAQPSPAGGFGGPVSPPAGSGAEPRRQANAFWQQSIENWLKNQVSVSPTTPLISDPIRFKRRPLVVTVLTAI